MPGQISIRLPDTLIARLNELAHTSGRKRSDILRACISMGLEQYEADEAPDVTELIGRVRDEVIETLNQCLKSQAWSPHRGAAQEIDRWTAGIAQTEHSVEVLAFDDPADEGAKPVSILGPEGEGLPGDDRDRPELFQDAVGQLRAGQRKDDTGGVPGALTEQRVCERLVRARHFKGWDHAELGKQLNMTAASLEEIEAGRSDVPHSRGIRVEAKLQQWEAEMTAAAWS